MNVKGQTGIIVLVVGLVIGIILLIGVLVPVINSTVYNGNASINGGLNSTYFSGVNGTIASNFVTFVLVGTLVLVAGIAVYGMSKR